MDYKEKYEQALKVAKETYDKQPMYRDWLDKMFPELAESEDERIRKEILGLVRYTKGRRIGYEPRITQDKMITWLEKQDNESVNIDIESMVSSYEQRLKSQGQGNLENNPLINMCVSAFRRGVENTLEELNLKKLEKQGEQKPVVIIPKFRVGDEIKTSNEESLTITKIDKKGYWSEDLFICGFDDADKWEFVEQKPAWSEEEEHYIRQLESMVKERWALAEKAQDEEVIKNMSNLAFFLKTLNPSKKPADEDMKTLLRTEYEKGRADAIAEMQGKWSEEDESMRTRCIGILGKCYMGELPTKVEEELNWLKSLRPQTTWKPSDEQIKGIECAIKTLRHQLNVGDKRLNSLYDNLKKLMEE